MVKIPDFLSDIDEFAEKCETCVYWLAGTGAVMIFAGIILNHAANVFLDNTYAKGYEDATRHYNQLFEESVK